MRAEEKKLLRLFRMMEGGQRETLLAFAEFLAARGEQSAEASAAEPQPIPRPAEESVVKAIRRLMATYPMLDRDQLLHETSSYMTQHVIHSRPAGAVIDELEIMFARHHERFKGSS